MLSKREPEYLDNIIESLRKIDIALLKGRLERGHLLLILKKEKQYIGYEGWVSSWDDFLDVISVDRETARQDIKVYEEFYAYLSERHDLISKCKYERLVRLLPLLNKKQSNKSSVIDLLEMAARSSRTDFNNNIRELKGLVPSDKCLSLQTCESKQTIILEKCTICGLTFRRKDLEFE